MPLYEMYPIAKGKRESNQDNCSNDLPFIPENDFVELLWENGQIMMHSQSCRAGKNSSCSNSVSLPPHETKARVRDIGNVSNSRTGKFGNVDSVFRESLFSVPTGEMGLSEDENVVPWFNYPPIDGSLQHLYGSDIFPEISGVTVNETFSQNTFPSIVKRCTSNQAHKDFRSSTIHNRMHTEEGQGSKVSGDAYNGPATSNVESVQFHPFSSQECQKSLQNSASKVMSSMNNSTSSASHLSASRESTGIPTHTDVPFGIKMQKQGPALLGNKSTLMNFSHFARPAALCQANFQNAGAEAASGISTLERMGKMDKGPVVINSAPTESTLVHSTSGSRKDANSRCEPTPMPSKVDSKQLEPKGVDGKPPKASCEGDAIMKNNGSNELPVESSNRRPMDGGKPMEFVGASSSVCSGNSVERVSDDPKANKKRKCHDTEESVCHSEDVEAESERVKRMASSCSNGSKRSRAAEVHNMSERRRRDKINEKMRALQELIPNCNKVDKASMLDEAIEYLRTLQLQVQIMSMGAGLYMPSMMLPTGMQHINPAHMSYFMPMGVGMGMGYGMGMLDLTGGSSGSPMVQFPPMQGAHFSCSPMPGSNLQMFGHPHQGFPISMPQAHGIPFSGGSHVNSSTGLNSSPLARPLGNSCPNSIPSSRDPIHSIDSQVTRSTAACGSEVQTLNQCQTSNVDFTQTTLMQNDIQAIDAKQSGALPSADD